MTSYNEWLKDYLMQGGAPTHVYEGLGAKDFVCIESNPHLVSLPLGKMCGAKSKDFVLSRKYDVEKYQGVSTVATTPSTVGIVKVRRRSTVGSFLCTKTLWIG